MQVYRQERNINNRILVKEVYKAKRKDMEEKETVETSSTRMRISSFFIACFVIGIILIAGLSGVASAFHAGVIPHADLIQSYTSTGGTPEYKDSDTDLVYKVQQGDTLTFSITLNPGYTHLECEWTVRKGSAVLTSGSGTSFSWTVPSEDSTWEIEAEVVSRDAVGNPVRKDTVSWSITTVDVVTVNPGESIQDAIDSICPEGGVVELAAGTHYIAQGGTIDFTVHANQKTSYTPTQVEPGHWIGTLTYKYGIILNERNNITITGAGRDATILVSEGTDYPDYDMLLMVKGYNNTIKDLFIKSNGTGSMPDTKGDAIHILGKASNIRVENVRVENVNNGVGAYVRDHTLKEYHGIENLTVEDCLFSNLRQVTRTMDVHNSTFKNCEVFKAWGNFAFNLNSPTTYTTIEKNTIRNCSKGIFTYTKDVHIVIRDNIIYGTSGAGIYVYIGAQYIDIINNIIRDGTTGPGILILNKYAPVDYVNIINNRIYNNAEDGIYMFFSNIPTRSDLDPPYDITIESNTIYNNGRDGIRQNIDLYDIMVKNNIIANNSGYGINHLNDESRFVLSYNDVWGNVLGSYKGTSAGTGDISEDPLFADPDNGDFHLKSAAGRWTGSGWVLDNETSQCIDAGDPSEKDPDGTRINMGAYGGTWEASKPQSHGIETYNISGYVRYTNGSGIYNAHVTNDVTGAEDYTDASGYYILSGLTNGTYTITASKEGYYPDSITESILGANVENANITLTEIVDSDTKSPTISNVSYSLITATRATITWDTDEVSTSSVKYGTSPGIYTRTRSDTSYVTSHSITLTGLTPNTTYYFVVNSTDKAGNSAESDEHSFTTLSVPQEGYVILWDTNRKYTEKNPFSDALADKANWTQVPYGVTNYTFTGDAMIENDYYYLFLFSNDEDSPALAAKMNGGSTVQNEIYKVHDTGYRNFGMGNMWVKILKNDKDEVIVKSAEKGMRFGEPPVPITTTYTIKGGKPWLEVRPVENVNQQGMHRKQRLAAFIYKNVTKDVLIDAKKHGEFEENVYPENGCIGIVVFHREYTPPDNPSDYDFLWLLTFPPGAENNSLTYAGVHYPDPYWEWDDKPGAPSVGAVYAYLDKMVIIGVLNSKDNWKREDVNQYLTTGQTYISEFTAPYAGKWRVAGVYTDDGWNITNHFTEVVMSAGEHFSFTSPRDGTLEYLIMYLFDRTDETPDDVTTIMDVYQDRTPPNINITNVQATPLTPHSAIIEWNTDVEADSKVTYDTEPTNLGTLWKNNSVLTRSHSILLSGLDNDTTYYFMVYSTDSEGNTANSAIYNFTTPHLLPPHGNSTVIIQSPEDVNDNRLRSSTPDEVLNDTVWIDVGRLSPDVDYRDVIWFNLSRFNSTDKIISAKLSLFWYYEYHNTSTTVEIYRPAEQWDENYVNWHNRTEGVTWNHAGGDWYDRKNIAHGNTPYAALSFPIGSPDNAYHEFDVTELVQGYVNGTYDNTGFFIKANELNDGYIAFRSSDWENASERPKLVVSYSWGSSSDDTVPPASIYNLENRSGATWINWTWTNPSDNDFAYTMVYLDGVFKKITSGNYYNATNLTANTTYEIGTHTVDTNGNINTTWVNQTAKTTLLLLPFPGCDNPPTDQDGDGIYEDINGNDELGFADVVIFTTNIEWIRDNEPIEHFDFNMDGKIDDNDLNILSEKVEGGR